MKRLAMTVAATLVSAAFSTAALAQDKPAAANAQATGKTMQAPDKSTVQRQQPNAAGQTQQVAASEVRNWAAIDTNKDHLISAEEMENYLKQSRKQ